MHKSDPIFTTNVTEASKFATFIGNLKEYPYDQLEPFTTFCTLDHLSRQSLFTLFNCDFKWWLDVKI